MQKNSVQRLSEALASVSDRYARVVTDSATEIESYPAPFLKRYGIYHVYQFDPPAEIAFYVGFDRGESAYLLTDMPENYIRMAKADGMLVNSSDVALAYATAYLEVTRPMSELFYLVHSVDEVKFRPDLVGEEAEAKASFMKTYHSIVAPPRVKRGHNGYVVTAYAVREQALERHSMTVTKGADIHDDIAIVEEDLPLVYGH